jgi:hypothetical protein
MPFDWNDFLALAQRLANEPDDASKRTAISRAYYSIFNLAFERAESTAGKYAGNEGFHKWCWNKYTTTSDRDCQRIGNLGDRMKRKRVIADYKSDDIPRLADEVRSALMNVRSFTWHIARLNPRHPLP